MKKASSKRPGAGKRKRRNQSSPSFCQRLLLFLYFVSQEEEKMKEKPTPHRIDGIWFDGEPNFVTTLIFALGLLPYAVLIGIIWYYWP